MYSVLFVCLGNICRSPTAHAIFQAKVDEAKLSDQITVDSCGTGDWHIGHAPDSRSTEKAAEHGYDLSILRARQFTVGDFNKFNLILTMDNNNLQDVRSMMPGTFSGTLDLFLRYTDNQKMLEVPDPYYGGSDSFDNVVLLIEQASIQLLNMIKNEL